MLCQFVYLLSRILVGSSRDAYAAYASAGRKSVVHRREFVSCHHTFEVLQFESESEVRLVRTEACHRLIVLHPEERCLDIDAHSFLHQSLDEAFLHRHDVVFVDEAHLEVDLCELRLTVSSEVFVSEALGYLHVAVASADHEKLLEHLRRLRKSVELSCPRPARYDIVSCSFRSRLDQYRCLYLAEAVLIEVVAADLHDLVPEHEVLLHLRFSQVEISVSEPEVVAYVVVVLYVDRRRLACRVDLEIRCEYLDLARLHVRVHRFTFLYLSLDADYVFASQRVRLIEQFLRDVVVENDLHDPLLVSDVAEDETAEVPPLRDPSVDRDVSSYVVCGQ